MISFLHEQGCLLVEQPLPKDMLSDMTTLKANSSLPLFADESVQRWTDLEAIAAGFHGVNIKLMKCGGLSEGLLMVAKAKDLNLKLLIGCMSESSVGCLVAAPLSLLADYADLDGPFLINNDLFMGMNVTNGRLAPRQLQLNLSGASFFAQAEGFEC
jgi:L-alanine-DL-glutamate epimerase-like enolase superfamily enzyme